eukprot:9126651-Alexandrium_andersonii.AAC.1
MEVRSGGRRETDRRERESRLPCHRSQERRRRQAARQVKRPESRESCDTPPRRPQRTRHDSNPQGKARN